MTLKAHSKSLVMALIDNLDTIFIRCPLFCTYLSLVPFTRY